MGGEGDVFPWAHRAELGLSLSGSTKRNLRHLKARTAYPSPFSQRENSKGFPGSSGLRFLDLGFSFPVIGKRGFPHSSVAKESACNAGDPSSITGLEDPLEKG